MKETFKSGKNETQNHGITGPGGRYTGYKDFEGKANTSYFEDLIKENTKKVSKQAEEIIREIALKKNLKISIKKKETKIKGASEPQMVENVWIKKGSNFVGQVMISDAEFAIQSEKGTSKFPYNESSNFLNSLKNQFE